MSKVNHLFYSSITGVPWGCFQSHMDFQNKETSHYHNVSMKGFRNTLKLIAQFRVFGNLLL